MVLLSIIKLFRFSNEFTQSSCPFPVLLAWTDRIEALSVCSGRGHLLSTRAEYMLRRDGTQCLAPTYVGNFALKGAELRKEGLNRIGNMIVPNSNYCLFEDWVVPIFKAMMTEQEEGTHWTPSSVRDSLFLALPAAPASSRVPVDAVRVC